MAMPGILNTMSDSLSGTPDTPGGPSTEQRNVDRRTTSATISFRQPGRKANMVSLRDVSATGCRFTSYARPVVGQRIWISLPGLESLAATVRWITGNDCGCQFDRALYPAVLDTIMQRLGSHRS